MSLMNVGVRALMANQIALQTTGHNIANVSTPGYSRQTAEMQTVAGQFSGSGYVGQGVEVATIVRNYQDLVTRQSAAAGATQAGDKVRAERLAQMQDAFGSGPTGLGAAINDMMNAYGDVVSSPTDLTARTVVLTRIDETAGRMRSTAERLQQMDFNVTDQVKSDVHALNDLAQRMAAVNDQIAHAKGNGQSPNDLLDQRDQLIRDINKLVQTTQVPADDGTMGLFVAGSQPLVLGATAARLSMGESSLFPGSGQLKLFFDRPGVPPTEIDENMLGGGSTAGLLRFHNTDLAEGRNLLGRMAQAMAMAMNGQNRLGLTLDGQMGGNLLSTTPPVVGHTSGAAVGTAAFTDPTRFAASDYEIRFTGAGAGQVIRLSDGKSTAFTSLTNPPPPATPDPTALDNLQIDGLTFHLTTGGAVGQRMLFQPFTQAASNIQALVHSPRDLAVASPVNAAIGAGNTGTLQLAGLHATSSATFTAPPTPGGVSITFAAGPPVTYTVNGSTTPPSNTANLPYTPGQPIAIDGWEITLNGSPHTGDVVTVGKANDPQYGDMYKRNTGNASAMLALRDVRMFDESSFSDGYAGLIAQVGTRTQSAQYAAKLSEGIAASLERDRSAVSGVNLDEEAGKLLQYQQAYQASAKMLQIAQNIFDNLIQGLGR